MARNYKELQAKMNPADVADNKQRVREELQRMALDELRNAKQLTQADMAELLDVPQSSISRIEQRADMYLSTLRNYVQAMGGVLQIQAVFPEPVEERDFRLPGIERVRLEGRTVSLITSRNLESITEHMRMLRAGAIDVLPISLKEIFLEKVRARS